MPSTDEESGPQAPPLQRAVFLDRDGVLNVERGFVTRPEQLVPTTDLPVQLRRLREAGYLRIVVSNQSAVARGLVDFGMLERIHARLRELCGEELDAILTCPHHPSAGDGALTRACSCRKPEPGMLQHAAHAFGLVPERCVMIGDAPRDLQAAHAFGCSSIGILGEKLHGPSSLPAGERSPEAFVTGFAEAVDLLLASED